MIYKIVNTILRFIIKRYVLIILNLTTLLFCLYYLRGMFGFIHFITDMNREEIDHMNEMIDSIAGVFVAIGVLMEERETIMKMSGAQVRQHDDYLNEVAHHNGMGLLLIGLFMELISLIIDAPKNIINTIGTERYFYIFGFVVIFFAVLVLIDFIKDYLKTYFKPVPHKHQ